MLKLPWSDEETHQQNITLLVSVLAHTWKLAVLLMLPAYVFSLMRVLFITMRFQCCLHHKTNLKKKNHKTLRTASGHLGAQTYLILYFLALHSVSEMRSGEPEEFLCATSKKTKTHPTPQRETKPVNPLYPQ